MSVWYDMDYAESAHEFEWSAPYRDVVCNWHGPQIEVVSAVFTALRLGWRAVRVAHLHYKMLSVFMCGVTCAWVVSTIFGWLAKLCKSKKTSSSIRMEGGEISFALPTIDRKVVDYVLKQLLVALAPPERNVGRGKVVNESLVAGSEIRPCTLPKYVVTVQCGLDTGMGSRISYAGVDCLLTASHVVQSFLNSRDSESIFITGNNGQRVELTSAGCEVLFNGFDTCIISVPAVLWSTTATTRGTIRKHGRYGMLSTVYSAKDGGVSSVGISFSHGTVIHHKASTLPGWSGSPLVCNSVIVGIHNGAGESFNVGTPMDVPLTLQKAVTRILTGKQVKNESEGPDEGPDVDEEYDAPTGYEEDESGESMASRFKKRYADDAAGGYEDVAENYMQKYERVELARGKQASWHQIKTDVRSSNVAPGFTRGKVFVHSRDVHTVFVRSRITGRTQKLRVRDDLDKCEPGDFGGLVDGKIATAEQITDLMNFSGGQVIPHEVHTIVNETKHWSECEFADVLKEGIDDWFDPNTGEIRTFVLSMRCIQDLQFAERVKKTRLWAMVDDVITLPSGMLMTTTAGARRAGLLPPSKQARRRQRQREMKEKEKDGKSAPATGATFPSHPSIPAAAAGALGVRPSTSASTIPASKPAPASKPESSKKAPAWKTPSHPTSPAAPRAVVDAKVTATTQPPQSVPARAVTSQPPKPPVAAERVSIVVQESEKSDFRVPPRRSLPLVGWQRRSAASAFAPRRT